MKIVDDSPSAPHRARPAELLHRPLGAAAQPGAPDARPRAICQRRRAAAHGACGLRALAARACADQEHRRRSGEEGAGRHRRRHRRGTGEGHHALGRRADASQGHQVGAAARHRDRSRLLARRSGLRRGRAHAAPRPRTAASWSRSTTRSCRRSPMPETALDPATPVIHPSTRRQSLLRARAHRGRSRQGLRRGRRRGRDHVRVRPPHRRHQRAARHRRRLESGRAAPDRLSGHAGAAHDAEPVRQASRRSRSIRSASSPRTSAARSASRCTPMPTRWRRWRCRSCSSGRSSSSPTGSRASSPTSMPATIA